MTKISFSVDILEIFFLLPNRIATGYQFDEMRLCGGGGQRDLDPAHLQEK